MTKSSQQLRSTFSLSEIEIIQELESLAKRTQAEVDSIIGPRVSKEAISPEVTLLNIFDKFHAVANILKRRYPDKSTLVIEEEKDVQDLLEVLLWLHFNDIRREEPVPSVAGGRTDIDFLLPEEQIGIEVKMGDVGHRELRKQINDDKGCYGSHPQCSKLFVFVYDPKSELKNPRAFESQLNGMTNHLETKVFVRPKP